MSENSLTRPWLSAALALAGDPGAEVACPECGEGVLEVTDVDSARGDGLMERLLHCPRCGAGNAIRLRQGEGVSGRES